MKVAVSLPIAGLGVRDMVDMAVEQIDAGYRGVWSGEVNGPDFVSMLSTVAAKREVDIAVAVAPVQTRATWLLAATAATLSELSGGRFTLGLGASSEVIVQRWSGIPFERPLNQVKESVEAIRSILENGRTSYEGDFVNIDRFPPFIQPAHRIPIYLGALNKISVRQAGCIADGICLNQLAPHHLPKVLAAAHAGRESGPFAGSPLEVMTRVFCLVTDDVAAARARIRREFAPYVATNVYGKFFRSLGFIEEVDAVHAAFAKKDRKASAAAMSDALVDTIAVIGNRDHVAEQLALFGDNGADTIVVDPKGDSIEEIRASLEPGSALSASLQ